MITFFQKKERLCAFIGLLKVYPIHTPSLPQWQLLSYIYVNEIGEIIKPGFLTSHFASVLKANNMPRIRFHDLRHTCASLLFAQGVSLKEIQAWLGHSTIGTTAKATPHKCHNPHYTIGAELCILLFNIHQNEQESKDEEWESYLFLLDS